MGSVTAVAPDTGTRRNLLRLTGIGHAPETTDKAAWPARDTHNISLAGQEKETQTS
jgi:hypothetical protein